MKAIKVMGSVNEQGQLTLDSFLTVERPIRLEVIVLIPEETEIEKNLAKEEILNDFSEAWQEAMNGETIPVEQLWED